MGRGSGAGVAVNNAGAATKYAGSRQEVRAGCLAIRPAGIKAILESRARFSETE